MNRIMRRPMFRKGGGADEGITSGFKQGYATNENNTVQQNDLSKINIGVKHAAIKRYCIKHGLQSTTYAKRYIARPF